MLPFQINELVERATAKDKENDTITFGIRASDYKDGSQLFHIDNRTGVIYLAADLSDKVMVTNYSDNVTMTNYSDKVTVTNYSDKVTVANYSDNVTMTNYSDYVTVIYIQTTTW